ncbi:MAG: nuclear transport factor 2 family protein [Gemmatimonadota bacterium]
MRRILLLAGILVLVRSVSAVAQGDEAKKAEVLATVQKLFDGMRARDTAAVSQVLDSSARLVTTLNANGVADMDITAVPDFVRIVAIAAPGQLLDERIGGPEVGVEDNLATVWVPYRFYLGTGFSHCGIDAFQLAKTSSGWKIIALADTRRAPAECESAAQGDEAKKAAVLATVQKLFDGMRARDTVAISQVMDPISRLMTSRTRSGAPVVEARSTPDFIHDIATAPAGQVLDERMQDPEVRAEDNLATVWTKYRFYVGERFSHCGVDVFQLARTLSGWKIIALAYTIRPAPECGT